MTIETNPPVLILRLGSVQAIEFLNDVVAGVEIKNNKAILPGITNVTFYRLSDIKSDGYVFVALSNTDSSTNKLRLYCITNGKSLEETISQDEFIYEIDQTTKQITVLKDISVVTENGTSVYASKNYVDTKIQEIGLPAQNLATENWVTDQDYVSTTALTSTLQTYATIQYVNENGGSGGGFDADIYFSRTQLGNVVSLVVKTGIKTILENAPDNTSLFIKSVGFRVPDVFAFNKVIEKVSSTNFKQAVTDSQNASMKYIEHEYKAGVRTNTLRTKTTISGWVPTDDADVMSKSATQAMISENSALVGYTMLYPKHATSGLQLPTNHLECNGQTFSTVTYPTLYAIRGSTTLQDLRSLAPSGFTYIIKAK